MLKNRLLIVCLALCLILATIPTSLGAACQKSTSTSNKVYISVLYVGLPHQTVNQEYVKITNKETTAVNMKGWKLTDKGKKHTYYFPSSYILKAKTTASIYSGKGKNTATALYWGQGWYVWNNDGDTEYLYNAQGKLVSSKTWIKT